MGSCRARDLAANRLFLAGNKEPHTGNSQKQVLPLRKPARRRRYGYDLAIQSFMQKLIIKTYKKREVLDITDPLARLLQKSHAQTTGLCSLLILHTTAALTTADLDPGTDLDMLDAFEAMMPKLNYRHPHNPNHVPDHILSALIGTSVALPFQSGNLLLGTWQRVVLIELDGPREREIVVTVTSGN